MAEPLGPQLRAYLMATRALPLVAPWILRRRLSRGKELADRWDEKLGRASLPRPSGSLVWLHAVGLGEVMALRGLIAAMAKLSPQTGFLVTSTTRASAEVLATNLPPRTRHQFLPLDAPGYLTRFLDHWRPDVSIWAEQDLWPGAVVATAGRGVPLALVNARMNEEAFARRRRWRSLYADLFARFGIITAQDDRSAMHLAGLGAGKVRVTGSLKAAAPPLSADPAALDALRADLKDRRVWVAASTHAGDEAAALAAQARLWLDDPRWLLVLVPRHPERSTEVIAAVPSTLPLTVASRGQRPTGAVHLVDGFGQLGLWYRLASVALIGGTFGPVEGHNPWEAAALGTAILHGARVANFASDFAILDREGAACQVSADTLAATLATTDAAAMVARGRALAEAAQGSLAPLARDLLTLGRLA